MFLDEIDAAVLVIGSDGIIGYINQQVCKDLNKAFDRIQGMHYREIFWPEFIPVYDQIVATCENGQEYHGIYYWAEMTLWEQISGRAIFWDLKPSILLTITNVSEIIRSEYHFENVAYFDNLLKLPNGAKLEEDITNLANVETVALLYFKITHFDDINNLYGWNNGDNLLKQIRDWLLSCKFQRSQLYRVNNGFAILGRKKTMEDARQRVKEIQERFKRPWELSVDGNELSLHLSINIGIEVRPTSRPEFRHLKENNPTRERGGGVKFWRA